MADTPSRAGSGAGGPRVVMTFPSGPGRARPAAERVVRAFADVGGGRDRWKLRLGVAVGEAVANASRHGNRGYPGRRIRVTARPVEGGVRVAVQDEGAGFDPAEVPDPRLPGRRGRPWGRGLLLQRELADETRIEDGGRRVVLLLRPER